MFKRTRFQSGSLTREERNRQSDVWVYRWRELAPDGTRKRRKVIIGSVDEYRTESLARRKLASLGLNINDDSSTSSHPALMTTGQLVEHYKQTELGDQRHSKAMSTVDVYKYYLRSWIEPRWKSARPVDIKPVDVEKWLRSLTVANGTKAKIRNVMSAVFQHGVRHQFFSRNPIRGLVRQSAKRQKEPDVLTASEIRSILDRLMPFARCMVFLAASTGLRFSEIRGLQWGDVDFVKGQLNLRRGVVQKHITELKTKASRKPVPLHPAVVDALRSLQEESQYKKPENWVFASRKMKGKVSVWPSSLMSDHILPAVTAAKINKHVSWHVFRHSYATLLKANGEDVKVVQESLRHANFYLTMDAYTQAVPDAVRAAHSRVVEQLGVGAGEGSQGRSGPVSGPRLDPGASAIGVGC